MSESSLPSSLNKLSYKQLQSKAKKAGIPANQKADVLREKLFQIYISEQTNVVTSVHSAIISSDDTKCISPSTISESNHAPLLSSPTASPSAVNPPSSSSTSLSPFSFANFNFARLTAPPTSSNATTNSSYSSSSSVVPSSDEPVSYSDLLKSKPLDTTKTASSSASPFSAFPLSFASSNPHSSNNSASPAPSSYGYGGLPNPGGIRNNQFTHPRFGYVMCICCMGRLYPNEFNVCSECASGNPHGRGGVGAIPFEF